MLRIGEFAALSSISIHMLRNYDKIGLLVPQHVDETSGYRYYDKGQLLQANKIVALKTMGLGLDDIKRAMEMGRPEVDAILQAELQDRYKELEKIKDQIMRINVVMNRDKRSEDYALSVVRKMMNPIWVAGFRGAIHAYPEEGILWGKIEKACRDSGIRISSEAAAMAVYHGVDENTGMMDVEVQFPLDRKYKSGHGLEVYRIPEREVVSVIFKGCYSQIGGINSFVAEWLEQNQLEINGEVFSIYHSSPGNCADEKEFVTELCFPITEK